jgi:hypothetical protein
MALDSSVMNVSIATVAEDLNTTITGIQSAIVLYTLRPDSKAEPRAGSVSLRVAADPLSVVDPAFVGELFADASLAMQHATKIARELARGGEPTNAAIVVVEGGRNLFEVPLAPRLRSRRGSRRITIAVGPLIGVSRRPVPRGDGSSPASARRGGHLPLRPPHRRRTRHGPVPSDLLGFCLGVGMGLAIVGVLFSSDWGGSPGRGCALVAGHVADFWLIRDSARSGSS